MCDFSCDFLFDKDLNNFRNILFECKIIYKRISLIQVRIQFRKYGIKCGILDKCVLRENNLRNRVYFKKDFMNI
jgi:hypothetical protein